MQKVKSNALWNELTIDQRNALDKWLFEEKQSHTEVWRKAQAQFKYKGSESSIKRYFLRRQKEKTLQEFKDLRDELVAISEAPADMEALRLASMKLLGRFLFRQMQQSPEKVKEWGAVAGLMLQNDHNEVLREGQKIKEGWLKFAKEKFQFDTMEEALKALPELRGVEEARKDPDLKRYEENAVLNRLRRTMFGVVWEAFPESAKEEEEMLAAIKERKARSEQEAEARKKREWIDVPQPPPPSSPHYQKYLEWKMERENRNWPDCPDYQI